MTRTVAIIQARMTSTRLPGKVLADLGGRPLLERVLERVRKAARLDDVWVATTTNAEDDPVVALCERLAVPVFRGDEHDVLGRYHACADAARADVIVRITADCPLIDPDVIDRVVFAFQGGDFDYVSNATKRSYPDGLDVETFSRAALERAHAEAAHPDLREHVTLYISARRPHLPHGAFRIGHVTLDEDLSAIQWSVNLPEDLERVRRLWPRLPEDFRWRDVLEAARGDRFLLGLPEGAPDPTVEAR